jgi:pimeloyl-ACP methyl ester carboxylesterase
MLAIVLAAALTVPVPERPGGRTIDLNVTVVKAKTPHDDAIFVLAGGPGAAATRMEGFATRTFAEAGRDLVFVDARGTGRSNPLHCDLGGSDADLQGYFSGFLPLDKVQQCRDELASRADLTQYTTSRIVDDLEAVREKLGYKQVDLYGTSYGTRVAIEYMRRYPRRVRTSILDGVVPPFLHSPETFAPDAQKSLERVLELCAADAKCREAFPDPRADYAAVMKAAGNGVEFSVKGQHVRVDRGFFGEVLRNFLYSPEVYRDLPLALHLAAKGDWASFGNMAYRYTRAIRGIDAGMFLSVICAEDTPTMDIAAARKAAQGTFLGTYRIDQQAAACAVWPTGAAGAQQRQTLRSSIPTLIVSGELDPVTPPRFGDAMLRTLPNGSHVVIPYGSHSGDTGGCQEKVMSEFVREGSAKQLDRACIDALKPPAFAVP